MLEKKPEEMPGMLDEPEKEEPEKKSEKKEPEEKPEKEELVEKYDNVSTTTTPPRGRTETPIREGVGSRNPRCALLPTSLHATARPNRSLRVGNRNPRWTLEGGRWTVARCV